MNANLRLVMTALSCFCTGLLVAGCPNQAGQGTDSAAGSTSGTSSGTRTTGPSGSSGGSTTRTTASFQLANVLVTQNAADNSGTDETDAGDGSSSSSSNAQPPMFTLIFNATNTNNTIPDVCQAKPNNGGGSGSGPSGNFDPAKACKCQFVWVQENRSNSENVTRTVETAPTQVTNFEVQCPAPDVYNDIDEIPEGTIIKIKLVPDIAQGNNTGFQSNSVDYRKLSNISSGDFRDTEGHIFRNVYHYTCYDIQSKGLRMERKVTVAKTDPETNTPISASVANEFEEKGGGSATSFSAQSYFYDFYVLSNQIGQIPTGSGSAYRCPRVNINGEAKFFPLDSQFAVAVNRSQDFPIEVAGRTTLGGAPVIGYAAKANADGTCPSFTDTSGKIRRTYRLRQFTAFYPIRYTAKGEIFDQSQPSNTIWVIDRPIDKLSHDPLKPLMRLGPKPCPFSFKTAQFGQRCMTDASLTGWNIDGTQIDGSASCPIFPSPPQRYLKPDGTLVIRPYRAFLTNYIENNSIRACAFQSSNPVDPEIVLSYDQTIFPGANPPKDFYCAKYYPASGAQQPSGGLPDPFDKVPGDCDLAASAAAIKTSRAYACLKTYDPSSTTQTTPASGCCQICSGPDCTSVGGGAFAKGRNAVFSPPPSNASTVPQQAARLLPRATPNKAGQGGCFDPYED